MNQRIHSILVTAIIIALFTAATINAAAIVIDEPPNNLDPKTATSTHFLDGKSSAVIEETIASMSYGPRMQLAKKFGLDTIRGKKLNLDADGGKSSITVADRPVGTDPYGETDPSIAVKPNNANIIVAVSQQDSTGTCLVHFSLNHGETWSDKKNLPLTSGPNTYCYDPVVRYSPSSAKVYASYLEMKWDPYMGNYKYSVLVSTSITNGATWTAPVYALEGSPGYINYDSPRLDVHTFWPGVAALVYVTATKYHSGGTDIVFTRSTNAGLSWNAPLSLATTTGNPMIQGSRPIGGKATTVANGNVTVCWYNSGTDGGYYGDFSIRCRNSKNSGASFGSEVTAFDTSNYDASWGATLFETPYYLGPNSQYGSFWESMFPSIITTPDGVLHMVFTASVVDSSSSPSSSENGNIYYVKSSFPYTRWSRAMQLNDDGYGMAQGMPTITAKRTTGGSILTAFWEDHRNSQYENPGVYCGSYGYNCLYDIYYASTNPGWGPDPYGGYGSNPNHKVTDASSVSSAYGANRLDSSTSKVIADRFTHVIWTDRSTATYYYDYYSANVYSDQVVS